MNDTGWMTINSRRMECAWSPGERGVVAKSRSKRGVWKWFYYEGGVERKRGMEPTASDAAIACMRSRDRFCGSCTDARPTEPYDAFLQPVPDVSDMGEQVFIVTDDDTGIPVTIIPKKDKA
jgi:hypothetical protein